jgi:hypothetical protein
MWTAVTTRWHATASVGSCLRLERKRGEAV